MLVINPGDYQQEAMQRYFSDALVAEGVNMSRVVTSPILVVIDSGISFSNGGAGTLNSYLHIATGEEQATSPVSATWREYYFGSLFLTVRPSSWVSGTQTFNVSLGAPQLPAGDFGEYMFYQRIIDAAGDVTGEWGVESYFQFNSIGFSYIKMLATTAGVANSGLAVAGTFTGLKITW